MKVTTEIKKTKILAFNREEIRDMVFKAHQIVIPSSAAITVRVPGGGDYSGTDLDICDDSPLEIAWEEHSTEG